MHYASLHSRKSLKLVLSLSLEISDFWDPKKSLIFMESDKNGNSNNHFVTNSNNDLTISFNSECSKLQPTLVLPDANFTAQDMQIFKYAY